MGDDHILQKNFILLLNTLFFLHSKSGWEEKDKDFWDC